MSTKDYQFLVNYSRKALDLEFKDALSVVINFKSSESYDAACWFLKCYESFDFDQKFSKRVRDQSKVLFKKYSPLFPFEKTCHHYKGGYCTFSSKNTRLCSHQEDLCNNISLPWMDFVIHILACKKCGFQEIWYTYGHQGAEKYQIEEVPTDCDSCGSRLAVKKIYHLNKLEDFPKFYWKITKDYLLKDESIPIVEIINTLLHDFRIFLTRKVTCKNVAKNKCELRLFLTVFFIESIKNEGVYLVIDEPRLEIEKKLRMIDFSE
ncbi:MAG: hypothetical protein ACFFD4_39075 [Candidatus Odinarchaeota archaeon]